MDKFDEKVIGYESTKNILRQILDALKRPELYKSKGASIPRGLLMESDPGLGKSLLATVFIKESGRKSLVFRKTSQENSFLDELRAAFSAAKEAAPSILLLEDLNLYVESNSPYAPEWACLQACIDDARNTDIFVIATTNDTKYMLPLVLYVVLEMESAILHLPLHTKASKILCCLTMFFRNSILRCKIVFMVAFSLVK